jgi:hypothetical protein
MNLVVAGTSGLELPQYNFSILTPMSEGLAENNKWIIDVLLMWGNKE